MQQRTGDRHKDEKNAELINRLDKEYEILKYYPQSDDPTLLEFSCNRDPTRKLGFQSLLYRYGKICRVRADTDNGYYIEIADRDGNEDRRW